MRSPEKFSARAPNLPQELSEGRRGILFRILEEASTDPQILEQGLDVERLNQLLSESDAGSVNTISENAGLPSRFSMRLHADMKYAPLAAFENLKNPAPEEIGALKGYLPFMDAFLKKKLGEAGAEQDPIPSSRVVIGFAKRDASKTAPVTGGYHSRLIEQGYRFHDAIIQANLRLDTSERSVYKIADLLRSITHDMIHALQYKLFHRLEDEIVRLQKKLDDIKDPLRHRLGWKKISSEDLETIRKTTEADLDELQRAKNETKLHVTQFGTFFPRKPSPSMEGDAAVFEYLTDKIAREGVLVYMEKEHYSFPENESEFEQLMHQDLDGQPIPERARKSFDRNSREYEIVKTMAKYGDTIIHPAEKILQAFGSLRAEIEAGLEEGFFTGKFHKLKEIGKRLHSSQFTLTDGSRLDEDVLRRAAQGVPALNTLFR